MSITIEVPGKWVLAGEHSVLLGKPAISLPLKDQTLKLHFKPDESSDELTIFPPDFEKDIRILIEIASKKLDVSPPKSGALTIESTIPYGAGLGSSAAMSVAITRWLGGEELPTSRVIEVATRLEDHFHGKSSGMDVATAATNEPIRYIKSAGPFPLEVDRLPRFSFHDTGLRSKTRDCIELVSLFREARKETSRHYDDLMEQAASQGELGLIRFNEGEVGRGLELIADAMDLTNQCFEAWNLVPDHVKDIQRLLRQQGALAVKLTGAGKGGFLVALWAE